MTVALAGKIARGESPVVQAGLVKDLGTGVEQLIPAVIADDLASRGATEVPLELLATLNYVTQVAPSFSLRGGTRGILRSRIARGLGLRWRVLLAQAGTAIPLGSIALLDIQNTSGNEWQGIVPWGPVAGHVLASTNIGLVLLPFSGATREDAIFPLDATMAWSRRELSDALPVPQACDVLALRARAAAAQLAGTMQAVFSRTLQYENEYTDQGLCDQRGSQVGAIAA